MKTAKTVLIIEDDPWFAEQQTRTLESEGFVVRHVLDGIAGMDALDGLLPDVIVLDVFLPGPNALVLLHEMQSYSDLATVPIILCTSSAADIDPTVVAPYGVKELLDKTTMRPAELVAAVRRVLL